MNTERELLLSAHLDDQLSPDERRSVESAVATDPAAAEALRSLAGVRDLVAGLSRPAGPDLAPEVLKRLEARELRRRGERSTIKIPRLAALVGGVAASLACLALVGGGFQPWRRPAAPLVAPEPIVEPVLTDSEVSPSVPEVIAPAPVELVGPPAPTESMATPDGEPSTAVVSIDRPGEEAPAVDPARSPAQELLDGRHSPRIFLVLDQEVEAIDKRVASLLGLSTRRDFHRIELPRAEAEGDSEGSAPEEAIVFVATLAPDELATLQERLAVAFPDRFEESDESPAIASEVVDQGRVSTLAANPAADIRIPPTSLAIRFPSREGEGGNWPPNPQNDEQVASEDSDGKASAGVELDHHPRLVQIWIIKPPTE